MKIADYWEVLKNGSIKCQLCPHGCVLEENRSGICKARKVVKGELTALTYGMISSVGVDPIEKKPLYHFHPGRDIFSIGNWGCNFQCSFCQNWSISQEVNNSGKRYDPDVLIDKVLESGSIGIAYTYNEPLIGYEFVLESARLAKEKGLLTVLVTNGYLNKEPADQLLSYIDALNIDLKSIDDSFYKEYCHGSLAPVQRFIEQASAAGCHVELTNMVIPNANDTDECITKLAAWISSRVGQETPLHLSAYHPDYKLRQKATDKQLLEHAQMLCLEYLAFVYIGNVYSALGQNTNCPVCKKTVIKRSGYETEILYGSDSLCPGCGTAVSYITK